MKIFRGISLCSFYCAIFFQLNAYGYDVCGKVNYINLRTEGLYWSVIRNDTEKFCSGLSSYQNMMMVVPVSHPQFAYYYGLVSMAYAQSQILCSLNVHLLGEQVVCDVTKTGYGIMLYKK